MIEVTDNFFALWQIAFHWFKCWTWRKISGVESNRVFHIDLVVMGNSDSKVDFHAAIVQLRARSPVKKDFFRLIILKWCFIFVSAIRIIKRWRFLGTILVGKNHFDSRYLHVDSTGRYSNAKRRITVEHGDIVQQISWSSSIGGRKLLSNTTRSDRRWSYRNRIFIRCRYLSFVSISFSHQLYSSVDTTLALHFRGFRMARLLLVGHSN